MFKLTIAFLLTTATLAHAATLNVTVTGANSDEGHLLISLFDRAEFFPDKPEKAIYAKKVRLKNRRAKVSLNKLKAGDYAIAIAHDANDNGKLDTNGIGIPTEGFGFSRNPKIMVGPPKFEKSRIHVDQKNVSTEIMLKYF